MPTEKIAPREVDEALLEHPAVAEAVTFAVPHATLGEDVAAAVVLRPNAGATPKELRQFAAGRLADFKVPRQVLIVQDAESIDKLGDKSRDQIVAALEEYLNSPAPFTILLIEAAKLDGRLKFFKLLSEKAIVVDLSIGSGKLRSGLFETFPGQ